MARTLRATIWTKKNEPENGDAQDVEEEQSKSFTY